jgi:GNAT superfamily N-acetyltransferase
MPYEIRQALPTDAVALSRLVSVLGYNMQPEQIMTRLASYSGTGGSRVFVAVRRKEVVGFLSFLSLPLFHEATAMGRITAMVIDPEHRRQGIGRSLMRAMEQYAAGCGCQRIEVTSGDHREEDAHQFYSSQGYSDDCRRFLKTLPEFLQP